MKILMHCVYFPPEVGGLESHVYYLCRALAARGHAVEIVTSRSLPGLPAHEVMEGVSVWRTRLPGRNPPGWALHALGSVPRYLARARDADVLHAQDIASVPPALVARTRTGAPVVTTFHTSHFLSRARRPLWRPVLSRFVRASDHALAASSEIARVAERLAPGVRVEALTNGVETSLFQRTDPRLPPAGRWRLLVPRRLFRKNGVEYLVRAMPYIVARVDAEAVLIGDGPERGRLEALARELGVADRLTFLGKRPNAEMPELLSSGDLAVFPSLMEATSVAALEAMACELPVAASRVGGLPEIVDEQVGALFEPADPEGLAAAVAQLLESGRLEQLGRRARARVVERWSNDRLAERHLEVYRKLIARRGNPAGIG
ncbi:MAG: glycosyltransferase family 4 protein [Gemmatimonadota bacterium]|nr:glycosyltransferase family 4 protein [Gemmatimonadota bacterium]